MPYYLGFDGGGTKTECVLLDGAGRVLAQGVAGPSNPLRVGFDPAFAALNAAAESVLSAAHFEARQIGGVCLGLAGAGRPQVVERVTNFLEQGFPGADVHVTTDLEVALEAAVGGGAGVVLVAGTGSAAYGRNASGQTVRVGGWGPWIGDEGSAFDIGRRAVAAAAQARDRSGPATLLADRILAALDCPSWEELPERVAKNADEVFPRVFPLVVEAAKVEDNVARGILLATAQGLARLASSVVGQLDLGGEEFLLSKAGGVFGRSSWLDAALDVELARAAPFAKIELLRVPPAVGAARLAQRLSAGHSGKMAHGGES